MSTHHEILEFETAQETNISAFQLFQLKVQLIHDFTPSSEVYFSACLQHSNDLFPEPYQLLHNLPN